MDLVTTDLTPGVMLAFNLCKLELFGTFVMRVEGVVRLVALDYLIDFKRGEGSPLHCILFLYIRYVIISPIMNLF